MAHRLFLWTPFLPALTSPREQLELECIVVAEALTSMDTVTMPVDIEQTRSTLPVTVACTPSQAGTACHAVSYYYATSILVSGIQNRTGTT